MVSLGYAGSDTDDGEANENQGSAFSLSVRPGFSDNITRYGL